MIILTLVSFLISAYLFIQQRKLKKLLGNRQAVESDVKPASSPINRSLLNILYGV